MLRRRLPQDKIYSLVPISQKLIFLRRFAIPQKQQEVGDNLSVCALKLQINSEYSKSKDQMIKRSCDFKGGSFFQYVTNLTSLVTIVIVINEI